MVLSTELGWNPFSLVLEVLVEGHCLIQDAGECKRRVLGSQAGPLIFPRHVSDSQKGCIQIDELGHENEHPLLVSSSSFH